MFVGGLRIGIVMIGAVAAVQTVAAPHPAGNAAPVASFAEVATKAGAPKILYYKNEDLVKTTTTTTKTPIYTAVQTPIKNAKGQTIGYTTTQKITGYNTVTTKSTAVTPKAELYTTNGNSTAKAAAPVKFLLSGALAQFSRSGLFKDVADHLTRVSEQTESIDVLLQSALNAHLARVSVQQNDDMRKISAWVAIAAVPTMLAGIYGMNFDNMPELRWHFGYYAVLLLMAVVCSTMYAFFRKVGWL